MAAGVESGGGRGGGVVGRGSARVDLARERDEGDLTREREELARGQLTNGAPPAVRH